MYTGLKGKKTLKSLKKCVNLGWKSPKGKCRNFGLHESRNSCKSRKTYIPESCITIAVLTFLIWKEFQHLPRSLNRSCLVATCALNIDIPYLLIPTILAPTFTTDCHDSCMQVALRRAVIKGGGGTQIVLKHTGCCNFQTIIVMYINVYISGMKMNQRFHFWYQILLKILIFWGNGKKKTKQTNKQNKTKQKKPTFLVKNFCDKLKKYFWVKNAKIAWKSC